jgi:predicted transposase
MTTRIEIALRSSPREGEQLRQLQKEFSNACNYVARIVKSAHIWNRVALHHLAYQDVRQKFPDLGSQMTCNVIYTVARAARQAYQIGRHLWAGSSSAGELPLMSFAERTPVFFDRHTVNILGSSISIFTMEGRLRLQFQSNELSEDLFRTSKISEIFLMRHDEEFSLFFDLSDKKDAVFSNSRDLPEFLVLDLTEQTSVHHG